MSAHGSPDSAVSGGTSLNRLILVSVPIISVAIFTAFLVFVGLSFGIRRAYTSILLRIFEYITAASKAPPAAGEGEEDFGGAATGDSQPQPQPQLGDHRLIERDRPLSQEGLATFYEGLLSQVADKQLLASLGPLFYLKSGLEAIVEDEVTRRFSAETLPTWNLLTRTNAYQHLNMKLTCLWWLGFCLRYFLLLPFRVSLALMSIGSLMVASTLLHLIPSEKARKTAYGKCLRFHFRLFLRSFSTVITFHNRHNKAKSDGICVANHTSPMDAIVLSSDRAYAMVGQRQPGFIGFMQGVFGAEEEHVWFDRSEVRDRQRVARRMRAHVEDPEKMPILIFPEGTCINNTSVMMFKKGSFEVGAVIYPAAIKYDTRFADCFWNSSKHGFLSHLFSVITSWAIVADVWYLPAMHQNPNETAIQFAQRVKHEIARQGGLLELEWDGNLKRSQPKPDLKLEQRKIFSDTLGSALGDMEAARRQQEAKEEEEKEKEKEEANEEEKEEEKEKGKEEMTGEMRVRSPQEVLAS